MWQAIGHFLEPFSMIWINDFDWAWPICEMIHFMGLALLIGTIGLLDLRILGFAKGLPIDKLEKLVPLGIAGFVVNLATGLVFILANPSGGPMPYLMTMALQIKLILIFLAGINAILFYVLGISRQMESIGAMDDAPMNAKIIAGSSIVLWIGVIIFGRLIMYNDTLLYNLGM